MKVSAHGMIPDDPDEAVWIVDQRYPADVIYTTDPSDGVDDGNVSVVPIARYTSERHLPDPTRYLNGTGLHLLADTARASARKLRVELARKDSVRVQEFDVDVQIIVTVRTAGIRVPVEDYATLGITPGRCKATRPDGYRCPRRDHQDPTHGVQDHGPVWQ